MKRLVSKMTRVLLKRL